MIMRILVLTGDLDADDPRELDTIFECEADDVRLKTIELFGPEMVTDADGDWSEFGDRDEDRRYHIWNRSEFIRYCEMFGLEYNTIEG